MVDWNAFYKRFRAPGFISGYEVLQRLGGGAFGEVYMARKASIGKPYAIKFLKLDLGLDHAGVEQELEQVRLFAGIDHPHLVSIEDMGVVLGVPYLVMGYAGEQTLARRIGRDDLDQEGALRHFVQACRGILALHDRRLCHFDIKPGNIFVKGDVARVGDYGLAKLVLGGGRDLGHGRGTPLYMAPEMLRGEADHRADVYSLGVLLFECLTGRPPFAAGALESAAAERPALEFPEHVSSNLSAMVEACLAFDPRQRPPSVHALLHEMGQAARPGDTVDIRWRGEVRPEVAQSTSAPENLTPEGDVLEWSTLEDGGVSAKELEEVAIAALSTGTGERGESSAPQAVPAVPVGGGAQSRRRAMISALTSERRTRDAQSPGERGAASAVSSAPAPMSLLRGLLTLGRSPGVVQADPASRLVLLLLALAVGGSITCLALFLARLLG